MALALRNPLVIGIALVAATLAVYAQVHSHEFVDKDDPLYIVESELLHQGLGVATLTQSFMAAHHGNWIPLTWISLLVDHTLYGFEPAGYHLTNVALHAASAVLLFLALLSMTGALGASAFVAAVFALHPLHVESVAWASERKDALSGFFWMLTLVAYARYAAAPSGGRYAATLLALILGLLSKPTVVTLPFVLLLLDYWPLRRFGSAEPRAASSAASPGSLIVEKLPMIALAAGTSVITFIVQRAAGAMGADATEFALPYRVANAFESWVIYVKMAVWPTGLATFYPHPLETVSMPAAAVCALALAGVSVFAVVVARTRPYVPVGWFWYLGTLVPVIGIVQAGMHARADRYMYLPLIGLTLIVAWVARDLAGNVEWRKRAVAAAGVAVLVALAWGSWLQVGHWRNTLALHRRAADAVPDNYLAHHRLGILTLAEGQLPESHLHFEEAVRIEPRYLPAQYQLASALANQGEWIRAVTHYEQVLRMKPDHTLALGGIGKAYEHLGRKQEAASYYRRAIRVNPQWVVAVNNLAWILATTRDPELRDPEEAVELAEGFTAGGTGWEPATLDTLGAAYAAAGRFDDAIRIGERAVQLSRASGDDAVADEIATHLARYRRGEALVE
jgi:tetratricopeptide (TPR) repeat protein